MLRDIRGGHLRVQFLTDWITFYRRAVQKCKVNGSLGQRWQTGTVRDHWPVELHVRLRHEIRYKARRAGVRWNRHAVCDS